MQPASPQAGFGELVAASAAVGATSRRLEKIEILADFFAAVAAADVPIAIAFLSGRPRQDKLGVGWAAVRAIDVTPAVTSSLRLTDVDGAFAELEAVSGSGSTARRRRILDSLFSTATTPEQDFLSRLLLRDLRQGATEGLMLEALAKAAAVPAKTMRRAAMLAGSIVDAGVIALSEGRSGLEAVHLRLFTPIAPMLASTADDVAAALAAMGTASVEAKLDGVRIQAHRRDERVEIYTRNLNEITNRVPEIVAAVRTLPLDDVILDGEAIAFRSDGRPHQFQDTMGRVGSEADAGEVAVTMALQPVFFDVLAVDGRQLIDEPLRARHEVLDALPPLLRVDRILTSDVTEAERFLTTTVDHGHEGVMIKDPATAYAAGRRGKSWLKVKPAHTLDLVVLAVEWGSGRRQGWLSNIHLGARHADGGFVMLGKTFKGMTDEMLAWQTERFLELETHRKGHVVYVRPEQVVEIAFDGIQTSSRYPGGMALRFARVKSYRHDKPASEADTIDTIRAIYERGRRD